MNELTKLSESFINSLVLFSYLIKNDRLFNEIENKEELINIIKPAIKEFNNDNNLQDIILMFVADFIKISHKYAEWYKEQGKENENKNN